MSVACAFVPDYSFTSATISNRRLMPPPFSINPLTSTRNIPAMDPENYAFRLS